jgi:hypothetical protein
VFGQGEQGLGYYVDQKSGSGSSGKGHAGQADQRVAADKGAAANAPKPSGRWATLLNLLPEEDRKHLSEQLRGSTPAEAEDMLQRAEALLLHTPEDDAGGDTIFLGMDTGDSAREGP